MSAGQSSTSHRVAALALTLLAAAPLARASYSCFTDLTYPYCVNDPSDGKTAMPWVLSLSGRGARGDASQVKSLTSYDAFGKLVSEYSWGNTDQAHTLAATKFITVIPIAPNSFSSGLDPQYWYSTFLDEVISAVKGKYSNVDPNRFHVVGYSMGAFGTCTFSVSTANTIASMVMSGGNCEQNSRPGPNGNTIPAPFSQINNLVSAKMPIKMYQGSYDTTVGATVGVATKNQLNSLGDNSVSLTTLGVDHGPLNIQPWTADTINWMLQQSRSGGGSSSVSSTSSSSSSSSDSDSDASTSTSSKAAAKPSATVQIKAGTNAGSSSSSSSSSSSAAQSTGKTSTGRCSRKRNRNKRNASSNVYDLSPRDLTSEEQKRSAQLEGESLLARRDGPLSKDDAIRRHVANMRKKNEGSVRLA